MNLIERILFLIITCVAVYLLFPLLIDSVLKVHAVLRGSHIAGVPLLSYVILIVPVLILLRLILWVKEVLTGGEGHE